MNGQEGKSAPEWRESREAGQAYLEEEVCEEDVDEGGPEQPALGAEETGDERHDHAAVAELGVNINSQRNNSWWGPTYPTNLYPSYATKSTTVPSSPIPSK